MKQSIQSLVSGIIIGTTLTGGIAIAKTGSETLEAWYSDIKIYINGTAIAPKDATGNAVEPFIVNGTTYLPVRAVGEALDKEVYWDGATNSVYLTDKTTPTPTPVPTQTPAPTPQPTATPNPTPTPTAVPTAAPTDHTYNTTKILQISGYREDAIKGEITTSWNDNQKNAVFYAKMRCNNGGLADYIDCEITLKEVISAEADGFTGYFDVAMNGSLRHQAIKGTVTVEGGKLSLHTEEYDYRLIASLPEASKTELVTYFGLQAIKYNGEKVSGLMNLEFRENQSDITLTGSFTAGEEKYTLQLEKIVSKSETRLEGVFTVLLNGEPVVNQANGVLADLSAPLGDVMTLSIEGFSTLTLRVVEIGY